LTFTVLRFLVEFFVCRSSYAIISKKNYLNKKLAFDFIQSKLFPFIVKNKPMYQKVVLVVTFQEICYLKYQLLNKNEILLQYHFQQNYLMITISKEN